MGHGGGPGSRVRLRQRAQAGRQAGRRQRQPPGSRSAHARAAAHLVHSRRLYRPATVQAVPPADVAQDRAALQEAAAGRGQTRGPCRSPRRRHLHIARQSAPAHPSVVHAPTWHRSTSSSTKRGTCRGERRRSRPALGRRRPARTCGPPAAAGPLLHACAPAKHLSELVMLQIVLQNVGRLHRLEAERHAGCRQRQAQWFGAACGASA